MAEEQKQATLADGQDAGKMLLDIEAKIGELALQEGKHPPRWKEGRPGSLPSGQPLKHERLKMTPKQVETAQAIAKNPEVVAEVIREAEENEDIPTKTAVLNKVRAQKAEARAQQAEEVAEKLAQEQPYKTPRPDQNEVLTVLTSKLNDVSVGLVRILGCWDECDEAARMRFIESAHCFINTIKSYERGNDEWQRNAKVLIPQT